MDPELAAALATLPPLGPASADAPPPTIDAFRAQFEALVSAPYRASQAPFLPPDSAYTVRDYPVPVEGGEISVRAVVPIVADAPGETFPVLVHLHGGGWSVGNVDLDDYPLRTLAVQLKLTIVNVDLAPEHPFPVQVDDSIAALKWVVENAALLKADLCKGFLVGGDSSGANLTAVVAHAARDDPFFAGAGRALTGQLLREPLVVHPDAYPEHLKAEFKSFEENRDVFPLLTSEMIYGTFERYKPDPADPRFAPILYPSHARLPRAYIQAMALDALRDDAVVYARVLEEAGVEVQLDVFPGVCHSFYYYFPGIVAAEKVRAGMVRGLEWLLRRETETATE
ncbi:Alpha/Beta hydrolase protein [Trametes elegans]|nr:Alpha/Beta hydrolase protein [Trametes elegans]